jgi:fructose-1,6-bisphosphatase II
LSEYQSPTPELVTACVRAAIAAHPWIGKNDKFEVDRVAVDAMRGAFNSFDFGGRVVIGEGAKDEAPMLFNGEILGCGDSVEWDIAVDPIDGTRLAAEGVPGAVAVVAASERDTMMKCPDVYFMHKLVGPAEARGVLDIDLSAAENIRRLSVVLNKPVDALQIAIINKRVNQPLIDEVRSTGANWYRFDEGDVAMAVAAATPGSGVDLMIGSGGNPEGVLAAVAVRVLGGFMQGKLNPRDEAELRLAVDAGYGPDRVLTAEEMVQGSRLVFALAGVTEGLLAKGVELQTDSSFDVEVFVLDSQNHGYQRLSVRQPA